MEFNLGPRSDETQEYLADAARTWPKLWGDIPGVTGTLMLCSAFALGGEFEFQWRVDFDSLATLSRIDAMMKSGEGGWRKSRKKWFETRSAVRAHVSRHVAGNGTYCEGQNGTDAAIHLVFQSQPVESGQSVERWKAIGSAPGVVSAQTLAPVMGSPTSAEQNWVRLENLDSLDGLDGVIAADRGIGHGQLFGEIRELDGSFFVGA